MSNTNEQIVGQGASSVLSFSLTSTLGDLKPFAALFIFQSKSSSSVECYTFMIFCIDYKARYAIVRSVSPTGPPHIECLFKIKLLTLKSYFCLRVKVKQRGLLKTTSFTPAVFFVSGKTYENSM